VAIKRLSQTSFPASTTALASLRIEPGAVVTSPANHDIWTTSTGLYYRYSGRTYAFMTITPQSFSRAGDLTVATGVFEFYMEYPGEVYGVRAGVTTVPTGSSILVDVNKNGTSLWNTNQANRPTIPVSTKTSGYNQTMDTQVVAAGDYLTVDIDQIGSTVAGANLTVAVWLRLTGQ
jgi:hypothetical protein